MKSLRRLLRCLPLLTALFNAGAEDRPNIILLLTDDQCSYSLGCYGNEDVKTPHIDQLGADGIIFDNHYDTTAICMASRANIMTGLLKYKTGTNFDHGNMHQETWAQSYPVLLRAADYAKYGILFDRSICWDKRSPSLKRKSAD